MRGKLFIGIGWLVLGTIGFTSSLHSEPSSKKSETRGKKPGIRQFRPLTPLNRTVPAAASAAAYSDSAPGTIEAKITVPKFAGRSTDLNRIPPPPIPASTEASTATENVDPLSTDIVEPPIPDFDDSSETLEFTPAEPSLGASDYNSGPQPTYADVPPETDSKPETSKSAETSQKVEKADQMPETKPAAKEKESWTPAASSSDGPTLSKLRAEAHKLAKQGLDYKFGFDDPDKGGLDCSGVVQHLLTKIGIEGVPRTSYDQYYWMRNKKTLDDVYGKKADEKLFKKLAPGDLIFWGNTWKSGHRVSHVMIYMGWNPETDKHYIFGAQSKKSKGMLGNGVDIFELDPNRGRLIGHGKIPGLIYD